MKMVIEAAVAEATEQWMDIEEVVGVGQGKFKDKDSLEVFVIKMTEEVDKKIPKSFKGFVVRIREVGVISAQDKN